MVSTSNAPPKRPASLRSSSSIKTKRFFATSGSCWESPHRFHPHHVRRPRARRADARPPHHGPRQGLAAGKALDLQSEIRRPLLHLRQSVRHRHARARDCQICGRPAELISEENYFFRFRTIRTGCSSYTNSAAIRAAGFPLQRSKKLRRKRPEGRFDQPQNHQVGHPLAGDPEHVFYVWYDALTSYMSGIGYAKRECAARQKKFQKFWPADCT
jgi:hypothetical protein